MEDGDKKTSAWRKSLARIGFLSSAVMILTSFLIPGDPSGWLAAGLLPLALPLISGEKRERIIAFCVIIVCACLISLFTCREKARRDQIRTIQENAVPR